MLDLRTLDLEQEKQVSAYFPQKATKQRGYWTSGGFPKISMSAYQMVR